MQSAWVVRKKKGAESHWDKARSFVMRSPRAVKRQSALTLGLDDAPTIRSLGVIFFVAVTPYQAMLGATAQWTALYLFGTSLAHYVINHTAPLITCCAE